MAVDVTSYVTYADAGRRLGVSRQAIWNLVARGAMVTISVGGRRYVPISAVRDRAARVGVRARRMERRRSGAELRRKGRG